MQTFPFSFSCANLLNNIKLLDILSQVNRDLKVKMPIYHIYLSLSGHGNINNDKSLAIHGKRFDGWSQYSHLAPLVIGHSIQT